MENNEQKREFTGLWIPRHIVEDYRLTWTERSLWAEISCFEMCYKSNAKLAERLSVSPRTVQRLLSTLKELGYIVEESFDGRKRQLRAVRDDPTQQGRHDKNDMSETSSMSYKEHILDNTESTNVDSSRNRDTTTSSKSSTSSISLQEMEGVFNHYIQVYGRDVSRNKFNDKKKRWIRARLKLFTVSQLKEAISNGYKDEFYGGRSVGRDGRTWCPDFEWFMRNDEHIERMLNLQTESEEDRELNRIRRASGYKFDQENDDQGAEE